MYSILNQTNTMSGKNFGKYFCLIFWGFIFAIGFTLASVHYFDVENYVESSCFIDQSTYPTSFPNSTTPDYFWTTCDCGRRCIANYPCLRLYSNWSSDFIKERTGDTERKCTFNKEECRDGELLLTTLRYLEETQERKNEYYNNNVTCYMDKDEPSENPIYLDVDIHTRFIVFLVFGGLFALYILILLVLYVKWCIRSREENKAKHIEV